NRLRELLEESFRHDLAWAIAGTLAMTLLLAKPPLGVLFEDLVVGQPAPRDLVVPLTVEIPDAVHTSAMREAARRGIPPAYLFHPGAGDRADRAIAEAFRAGRVHSRTPAGAGPAGEGTAGPGGEGTAVPAGAGSALPAALRQAVLAPLPPG